MTEVDSAQNHFAPPPLSFRRSVSGRIASVFKGKQKQSDEPQPPPPTALSSNTSPTDHDLPPDLRTFTALRSSPERITIIPHTPRRRRRADSSGTETYPTPSSNKPVNNTTASPSRKRDSTRSASRRQSQDTFLKVDDETRTTTTATSSHALLEAQPLAPLQSRTDEEGLSNVSTTSVDAGSTRARRKLKRRSQALPPSPHRTGSKVLSQVPTQNSLPSGTSCKDEAPRRLKKRPLSLTGIFNKQPSEDPQPNPSTPKSPSVPSNWFRLHRPSASIGSTSGNESHQSLNEAVLSPPPSTTSLTFQQPQGFFRSRIFNKPTSDPVTAASSPTAPTAPRSSPEQRRKSSSSPPKRSLSKRRPQALLHRSSAPFDPTAATLTDTTPECSGFNDMHSNDPSEPPTPRRPLPPIGLVKQPNSGEQLGSRTLAENDAETSPSTAKRPSSYFTVATNSSRGLSPDESLFNPTTGSTVQRRLSLSDLRIPTSITEAQQKIGADLQRVKEFKTGVEGETARCPWQ